MRRIKLIADTDVGTDTPTPPVYEEREAARGVVFDADDNVALLHATKKHYHKLPGGGLETGEGIEMALRREVQEEIGCSLQNIRELGMIEERRNKYALHQISYCFLAEVNGKKGTPHLEESEIADGFETVWLPLEDAIHVFELEAGVDDYEGRFIRLRDVTFLEKAREKLQR